MELKQGMAETEKGKKIVYVHPCKRADGTRLPAHERSTPDTSRGLPTADVSASVNTL